jgi:hypothetical protein
MIWWPLVTRHVASLLPWLLRSNFAVLQAIISYVAFGTFQIDRLRHPLDRSCCDKADAT